MPEDEPKDTPKDEPKDTPEGTPEGLPEGVGGQKVEVKVNGETKTLTYDQLQKQLDGYKKEYAHYGGAAQAMDAAKKMEKEAKESMEKAQRGLRIGELIEKIQGGNAGVEDINEYCETFGLSEEQRNEMLYGTNGDDGKSSGKDDLITEDRLDPSLRQKLERLDTIEQKEGEAEFQEYVKDSLDKVEGYGKIVKSLTDRGVEKKDIQEVKDGLTDTIRSITILRMQQGKKYGPELVRGAAETAVERILKIGIQTPKPIIPVTPGLGGGEMASLSAAFQEGSEPKRKPSGDDNEDEYIDNVSKRFFYRLGKAMRRS